MSLKHGLHMIYDFSFLPDHLLKLCKNQQNGHLSFYITERKPLQEKGKIETVIREIKRETVKK